MQLFRLSFSVPYAQAPLFIEVLESFVEAVSWKEKDSELEAVESEDEVCEIEGISRAFWDEAELQQNFALLAGLHNLPTPVLKKETIQDKDWLHAVHQNFPPLRIGKYFIHGSHYQGDFPEESLVLEVNAATAFGSGEHPSTHGCLLALEEVFRDRTFEAPLDMGCGSGILALAVAKTGGVLVTAADNDPESVHMTEQNALLNECESLLRVLLSEGFENPRLKEKEPYDLIIANILAAPLCALAPLVKKFLSETGIIILSGLLKTQKEKVLQAYAAEGLYLWFEKEIDSWTTLTLQTMKG